MNEHVLTDNVRTDHWRLFEAVCKNASDAIFVMDENQQCVYLNPAAEGLTGFKADEVRGRPLHDVIHHTRPDGSPYPLEECPIDRAFPERMRMQGEELFIHKDGRFLPVAYTASPIYDEGGIVGTILEVRDIREQKRSERALRESEEFSRKILESSQDCIKVLDLGGRLLSINPYGAQALELSEPQESLGANYLSFWSEADRKAACLAMEEARAGRVGRFTASYITPSARETWWDEIITLIEGGKDKPDRFLVTSRDITERTIIEQALRKSEEHFNFALEAAHVVGTWDWDVPNDRVYADERLASLFSISPERAAAGAPVAEFFVDLHPDDVDRVAQEIQQALECGSDFASEYRLVLRDGSVRWFFARGRCYRDQDGRPTRFPGVAIDVTDRRKAEQARRESELRFSKVFEHSHDAIFILDPERNRIVDVNPAGVVMFGYDCRDEVLSTPLSEFHPEDLSAFLDFVRGVFVEGAGWTDEFACRTKTGGTVVSEISASTLEMDGMHLLLAHVRDVGERKRAEQALRDSEARLRATYEHVQVGICEVDLTGRFLRVNAAFSRITGYESSELIGMSFADITHPADIAENSDALSRMRKGETNAYHADKRYIRKDGTVAWANLSSVLILGADKRPAFALTAVQDITERKHAEQHQKLLLDELNHRVKNMLATVLSIAAQSFRGDNITSEMRSAFQARLFALSEAHGLLTRKNWQNVGIRDVAMKTLEPFRSLDGTASASRSRARTSP